MMTFRDVTGHRFGQLTAIARIPLTDDQRRLASYNARDGLWACKCDCGRWAVSPLGALVIGDTISCGCVRSRQAAKRNRRMRRRTNGTFIGY